MKKILLVFAMFLATGFLYTSNSKAGCEESLPNNLQACFNAVQLNALDVTVVGSNLYVTGTLDPQYRDLAQVCLSEYEAGAATCPGAPTIVYGTPSLPNYNNGTTPGAPAPVQNSR